jgi:hypothetical protein
MGLHCSSLISITWGVEWKRDRGLDGAVRISRVPGLLLTAAEFTFKTIRSRVTFKSNALPYYCVLCPNQALYSDRAFIGRNVPLWLIIPSDATSRFWLELFWFFCPIFGGIHYG